MPSAGASAAIASAAWASAAGVSAESTTSSVGSTRRRNPRSPSPPYSSSAMWKLEPPKPNELTPARRGCASVRTQGRARVLR